MECESHPKYGGCFETLNLVRVRSREMFKFCDVLHETKQKKQKRKCAVRISNHSL